MKTTSRILVAASMLAMSTLVAQATDQNIVISATVSGFCKIDNSLTPANDTISWTAQITDGFLPGTPTASNKSYAVVCNKATNISLTSINGGMTGPAAATGFDHIINYTVAASGFATIATGSTATTATAAGNETLGTDVRATPGSANISLVITPVTNTNPLVEGSYQDTLRLRIEPQ